MPRLPALFRPKKKWRLASHFDPLDYLEGSTDSTTVWRRNYSTLQPLEQQVLDVMRDQATRGQVLVLSETEAKLRYPDLVIASLGAQRKEKPGGKITARVLFDGTHGLSVNSRTRIRDQEWAPIAADLKRTMREKAKVDELTFALSADVTEAHRQVPIHPDDWHLLGCQVIHGGDVFVNTVGTFGVASESPTARKDLENAERSRWVASFGDLLRHTDTPMGRLMRENPSNIQLLGSGLRAGTLRSRVRSIRKFLEWLSAAHKVAFPVHWQQLLSFFKFDSPNLVFGDL